ncbi:MAG: NAD(P)-dependent oxidoreductase [Chloroflexi bacterium]|nr:NAD(P)-dependent oxidoreductase [Chloroflexota bacterium]
MRVGFIGMGKMGLPMAANILKAGHTLIVHDIDQGAASSLLEQGATWADTPREVAEASEVVMTSLPGPTEVEAVALGHDGILSGIQEGAIYADMSTGSATILRHIHARFEARKAFVLDAPVSGGIIGAEQGTLAVMVGGSQEAYERAKPLFETIGKGVTHVGEIGTGTVAKLVHNAISMTTRIVVQEGLVLAVKAGVDPNTMLEVLLNASFGKQLILTNHIPEIIFTGDFDHPRFSLSLSHKDVGLALDLAKELDVPMALIEMADQRIQEGMDRGWGDQDNMVTVRLQEEAAGVEVRVNEARS